MLGSIIACSKTAWQGVALLTAGQDGFLNDSRNILGAHADGAEVPLHTNGVERDIRRLKLESVGENLPVATGEGFTRLPENLL
jgi:hypothetical protein